MGKKIAKIFSALSSIVLVALLVATLLMLNPWNMPQIFKRNYPEWFAKHPLLDKLIKFD